MYCSACGQALVAGAAVCPRCGRPAGVAPVPFVYNRVHRHVQTLGWFWIAYALWSVLGALLALPFLEGMSHGWFGNMHMHSMQIWPFGMYGTWHWLMPVVIVTLFLRAILSAAVGIGLLQRAPWARVLAIIAAVLTLIKPITGTILAIYTLWVMAPGLSAQEWDGMSRRM